MRRIGAAACAGVAAAGALAGRATPIAAPQPPDTVIIGSDAVAARAAAYRADPAVPPGLVWDVRWAETPGREDVAGIYPARALSLGLGGRAGAECRVGADGGMSGCKVVDELPAGFGFGAAALELADDLRAELTTTGGVGLLGKPVRFGVMFSAGERRADIGLCEALSLTLAGQGADKAAQTAAAASLARAYPHSMRDAGPEERIRKLAPLAALLAREQPESARRMAEPCSGTAPTPDLSREYPIAARVWVDEAGTAHAWKNADWARRPLAEEVARVYPARALEREVQGRAAVECVVSLSGELRDCIIIREAPAGEGFGEALLRLAPVIRMTPETIDGVPQDGGLVRIPVVFALPE